MVEKTSELVFAGLRPPYGQPCGQAIYASLRFWKQWKQPCTRRRQLLALGVFPDIRGISSSVRKQSREMLGSLTTMVQSPKTLGNQLAATNQT